jgi:hypothetical protein
LIPYFYCPAAVYIGIIPSTTSASIISAIPAIILITAAATGITAAYTKNNGRSGYSHRPKNRPPLPHYSAKTLPDKHKKLPPLNM